MLDLAIKGGVVVTEDGQFRADIGIEAGCISLISSVGALPPARRELIVEECLVMPGAIDIHFHVRAPGHPQRGTFISETEAAAAGGVTTILEMPISVPCCASPEIFEMRRKLGERNSYVNFGLYGAPGRLVRDDILGMADAGAIAFKIFTHAVPAGREEEFSGLCLDRVDDLYRMLELVKESGRFVSCHAESEQLIQLFEGRTKGVGRKDPRAFVESRPPVVEAMSIAQLAVLSADLGVHVHIAHVSGATALHQLQLAQAAGVNLTGETCPQYLLFNASDMDQHGPFAMIKPPLRKASDNAALWEGLIGGSLLAIASDHAPFTLDEKERGLVDIWKGAIGLPGIEALLPMILTEALDGRFSLQMAVRLLCSQPARLFNLYPQRGTLQVGEAADVVIYSLGAEGVVDSTLWFTKARAVDRLYNGRRRLGVVRTTIVNGAIVYDNGQIVAQPGGGRFLRPLQV